MHTCMRIPYVPARPDSRPRQGKRRANPAPGAGGGSRAVPAPGWCPHGDLTRRPGHGYGHGHGPGIGPAGPETVPRGGSEPEGGTRNAPDYPRKKKPHSTKWTPQSLASQLKIK